MDYNDRSKPHNYQRRRKWRDSNTSIRGDKTTNETQASSRSRKRKYNDSTDTDYGSGRIKRKFVLIRKIENTIHPLRKLGGLETIITRFSTEDLISLLSNKSNQFGEYLISDDLTLKEFLVLLEVLSKVCNSTDFDNQKATIITQACQKTFVARFQTFLVKASTSSEINICHLILLIIEFLESAKKIMQFLIFELKAEINTLHAVAKSLLSENNICIDTELLSRFELLKKEIHEGADTLKQEKLQVSRARRVINPKYFDPPTVDFREIQVLPTFIEITSQYRPKLWPNIIDGPYLDAEHYLGVQYRLLREDFIRPLREGIGNYLNKGTFAKKNDAPSIRIYPNVNFLKYVFEVEERGKKTNHGHLLKFQLHGKKRIDWSYSKRFMFGSLLCFSKNNFETVLFATVENRDEKFLKNNEILVSFCDSNYEGEDIYNNQFVMVESEVYFEPYYQVLKTLKTLDDDNFPMKSYVIETKNLQKPPKFLEAAESPVIYKYFEGSEDLFTGFTPNFSLNLFDLGQWPTPKEMGLDESQHKALHSALTNELSVIQGPPGTGKTFIALKIVETLIKNQTMEEPILVISLTNHALDQFLLGILNVTEDIVRIGGQSKCSKLNRYNLRRIRCGINSSQCVELDKLHLSMLALLKRISFIENGDGILSFQDLKNVFPNIKSNKFNNVYSWLLDFDIEEFVNHQVLKTEFRDVMVSFSEISVALRTDCYNLEFKLRTKQHEVNTRNDNGREIEEYKLTLAALRNIIHDIQILRTELKYKSPAHFFDLNKNINVDKIPIGNRVSVYLHWANKMVQFYEKEKEDLVMKIRVLSDEVENLKWKHDAEILKQYKVIGMTTNGAARLHEMLKLVKCRRVIVEEAAEVMESHIISCLNQHCEQLILIGDHKQLRPNISVYELGKHFNFDVSLFERLVLNGINCHTLEVQHRMAPEIATLIVPSVYPTLFNDDSVLTRKCMEGFQDNSKRMFFITHSQPEQQDSEISSRRNEHEADFIVALYKHLILQGYSPNQITILSAYKGQMFYIKRKLQLLDEDMRSVCNTVVDNYQGEENDIILLSLVRSNDEQRIGFLATENRVCVALSRARNALYCIGNMDLLCSKSELWRKIRASFQALNAIGNVLPLRCTIHPEETCSVSCAQDFESLSPSGGCKQICTFELKCGHMCGRTCHTVDQKHEKMKCLSTNLCKRICAANLHFCKKYCVENCGECMITVEKELPCGDKLFLQCRTDPKVVRCEVMVEKTFENCQHVAIVQCHERICPMDCAETLQCGHICKRKCHKLRDPEHHSYRCKEPCTKISKSCSQDHVCKRLCYENCSTCRKAIIIKLKCGHSREMLCSEDPNKKNCKFVVGNLTGACGHEVPLFCWEKTQGIVNPIHNKRDCKEICGKLLECGHFCKEKCSDCFQGQLHSKFCQEQCERVLVCGRRCNLKCGMPCSTCSLCKHVKCYETTCNVCVLFNAMQYELKCKHHDCSKNCSKNSCNRSPCNNNCERLLSCGHKCSGLCGEKCPKLCWTCHREKLTLESMCSDTVENPKFYVLPDCEHIIEVKSLEKWFSWQESVIRFLTCPLCNVRVTSSLRYRKKARMIYNDLEIIQDLLNQTTGQRKEYSAKSENDIDDLLDSTIRVLFGRNEDELLYGISCTSPGWVTEVSSATCSSPDFIIDSTGYCSDSDLRNKRKCFESPAETKLEVLNYIKKKYNNIHVSSDMEAFLENILKQILNKIDQRYNLQAAADISLEMLKFHYCFNGLIALTTEESKKDLEKLISVPRRFTIDVQEECLNLICHNVSTFKMPSFNFKMVIPRQSLQSYWFKCPQGHIYCISHVRNNEKIKFCHKCQEIVTDIERPTFSASENKEDQHPLFCNNNSYGNNNCQRSFQPKKDGRGYYNGHHDNNFHKNFQPKRYRRG